MSYGSAKKSLFRPLTELLGRDPGSGLSLNISDSGVRQQRAEAFGQWVQISLGALKESVCFVDYLVFQDLKLEHPYFYVVAPSHEAHVAYTDAVKSLVEGAPEQLDSYSVAFHPDFVGSRLKRLSPALEEAFAAFPIRSKRDAISLSKRTTNFVATSYPLWPSRDDGSSWPPQTASDLEKICGKHSLQDCLLRFQRILESSTGIQDEKGRPLRYVMCIPFLMKLDRETRSSLSGNPFANIAAELFLGVSTDEPLKNENVARGITSFVQSLALKTYRSTGIRKAEKAGESEGTEKGIEEAIEAFAHQIKAVANAMTFKWAVSFPVWEQIKAAFADTPGADVNLAKARVLPAPQLYDAMRETLVIWSQTRRVEDLYEAWPQTFTDIILRSWEIAVGARFAVGSINRNLSESVEDISKVWASRDLMLYPDISGEATWSTQIPFTLSKSDRRYIEKWICGVTRLFAALFDNYWTHADTAVPPKVAVGLVMAADSDGPSKLEIEYSNVTIGGTVDGSRLRIGMEGADVLRFLALQLPAKIDLPNAKPRAGTAYRVKISDLEIPTAFPMSSKAFRGGA
jgi:hypothetical protein